MSDSEAAHSQNIYDVVLADLHQKKEQEIKRVTEKYDAAIAAIKELLAAGVSGGAVSLESISTDESQKEVQVSVGEFHGMPATSAARVLLERAKRPLKTEQIVALIQRSGRKLEAKNPAGNVYSSLKRNTDFELVAPNTWGLAVWYPGAARKSKAVRVEEIMKRGPISINEAVRQAEQEEAAEVQGEKA